jgi:hypothetical protein
VGSPITATGSASPITVSGLTNGTLRGGEPHHRHRPDQRCQLHLHRHGDQRRRDQPHVVAGDQRRRAGGRADPAVGRGGRGR